MLKTWKWKQASSRRHLNQAAHVHPHHACSDKSLWGLTATLSLFANAAEPMHIIWNHNCSWSDIKRIAIWWTNWLTGATWSWGWLTACCSSHLSTKAVSLAQQSAPSTLYSVAPPLRSPSHNWDVTGESFECIETNVTWRLLRTTQGPKDTFFWTFSN